MNTKIGFATVLSMGLVALQSQAGVKYDVECTNAWFEVNASSLSTIALGPVAGSNGSWTAVPTNGTATVEGSKIKLDTAVGDRLVFTPTYSNAVPVARIVSQMKVTQSSDLPSTAELVGAKTALCVCTNGTSELKWFAFTNGAWAEMTAGVSSVDLDKVYEIVLETDVDTHQIRYLVRNVTDGDSAYTDISGGWIADSALTSQISAIAFSGETEIDSFYGKEIVGTSSGSEGAIVFPAGDSATPAAVAVSKDWIQSVMKIEVTDATTLEQAIEKINTKPAGGNDMTYWQSYVLGLTPSDSTSKPIVQPVQNSKANTVEFSLGNVAVNAGAGVPVKYRVNSFTNPACTEGKVEGGLVNSDANAEVNLPTDAGVKYYKLEIKFGN